MELSNIRHNLLGRSDAATFVGPGIGSDHIVPNPLLGPLADHGGPTFTMGAASGQPGIDAGDDSLANTLATDQRGAPRRYGSHVDIGAFESELGNVTSLNDSGAGSLRNALATRAWWVLPPALTAVRFTLTSGQLALSNSVTIDASSLPRGLTISGNNSNRIFEVTTGAVARLASLVLTDGNASPGVSGGAILVDSGGTLTISGSTVSSNFATYGGGIANAGVLTLSNSVVVGNVATYNSGGLENDGGTVAIAGWSHFQQLCRERWRPRQLLFGHDHDRRLHVLGQFRHEQRRRHRQQLQRPDPEQLHAVRQFRQVRRRLFQHHNGTATIYNSTFSGNTATNNGGGIVNNSSALTLNNSTLYGNSAGFGGALYNVNTGTVMLINATLFGNSASSGAGGGGAFSKTTQAASAP